MPYPTTKLQTPAQWLEELHPGWTICDYDGWRDKPFTDPVSREEFEDRFAQCTVTRPPAA